MSEELSDGAQHQAVEQGQVERGGGRASERGDEGVTGESVFLCVLTGMSEGFSDDSYPFFLTDTKLAPRFEMFSVIPRLL